LAGRVWSINCCLIPVRSRIYRIRGLTGFGN
jgi:hypothetical protein